MSMYLLHMTQVMEHHIMQLTEWHIVREVRPREDMHLGTYICNSFVKCCHVLHIAVLLG